MKSLFILFTFIFSANSFAILFPKAWVNGNHYKIKLQNHIELNSVHLENKNGSPVLFLHGYMATVHTFMPLGSKLFDDGFDIYATDWNTDSRDLEESTQTIRALIERIYLKTNKKVLIIGHSLGGVVAKLTVHGVTKNIQRGSHLNKKFSKWATERVSGIVSIASPNGESSDSDAAPISIIEKLPEDLISKFTSDLSLAINQRKILKEDQKVFAMTNILNNLRYVGIDSKLKGLFSLKNFSYFDYTLSQYFLYGSQAAGKKISLQVKSFTDEVRMGSMDYNLNYNNLFLENKNPVPVFYVAGENDLFSPKKSIEKEALAQSSELFVVKNSGHIDVKLGKNLNDLKERIIKFAKQL